MPEGPEQEAAFLSFPETGKDIAHRHFLVAVVPYILVFEIMVVKHDEQCHHDTENSNAVNAEGPAADFPPGKGFCIVTRREIIADACQQGKNKRKDHEYIPGFTDH